MKTTIDEKEIEKTELGDRLTGDYSCDDTFDETYEEIEKILARHADGYLTSLELLENAKIKDKNERKRLVHFVLLKMAKGFIASKLRDYSFDGEEFKFED